MILNILLRLENRKFEEYVKEVKTKKTPTFF